MNSNPCDLINSNVYLLIALGNMTHCRTKAGPQCHTELLDKTIFILRDTNPSHFELIKPPTNVRGMDL
eukprot:TRINITY_DN4277_c0_g1_i1.p1 TRINITY_DN4277_c0_g1~~TRINITY_DN4277_c0_g1_i1.p1  ORF type:complete len:68 (+),score=5.53 TRINITY_DN4277_c0_g1_i1:142-345(+)